MSNELESSAEQIKQHHDAFIGAARTAIDHALAAGELLVQAKDRIEHGKFEAWVEGSCGIGIRNAQRYMQLHRHRDALPAGVGIKNALEHVKSDTVSYLENRRCDSSKRSVPEAAIGPVAKSTHLVPQRLSRDERIKQIRDLSSKGFSVGQIANRVGIGEDQIARLAKGAQITLWGRDGSRKIDRKRVVEATVLGVEAKVAAHRSMGIVSVKELSPNQANDLVKSLDESLPFLRSLRKQLRIRAKEGSQPSANVGCTPEDYLRASGGE